MRTIVLVAAALAALPLTSIRAHADGRGAPVTLEAGQLRLSHLCTMPGRHSRDWRFLRSQPGLSNL